MEWLREFVSKWKECINIPWHCQIRLELTKETERLELFRDGGCTGITLAIESGNLFLREYVLRRHMKDELILEGVKKIKEFGFSLRTEQVLAVPFSNITTDLHTLELNCRIHPEMAWSSILVPYSGTEMGNITSNFGLYSGNNDDLQESFFAKSVLKHCHKGPEKLEPLVKELKKNENDNPLLRLYAVSNNGGISALVFENGFEKGSLCEIEYLNREKNERYIDQTAILHCLFSWLSLVPEGYRLGEIIILADRKCWTWKNIGIRTKEHLDQLIGQEKMILWLSEFVKKMGCKTPDELPEIIRLNPYYFMFFYGGHDLAKEVIEQKLFCEIDEEESFVALGTIARQHIFMTSLYKLHEAEKPIVIVMS